MSARPAWAGLVVGAALAALSGALATPARGQAPASPEAADTTEAEALAREDAWTESGGEPGLVTGDAPPVADAPGAVRGRLVAARGGYALWSRAALSPRVELAGLVAREPGEMRRIDDAYARAVVRPHAGWTLALGRVDPAVGAGLVLGPLRVRPRAPGRFVPGAAISDDALVPATPARAAASVRGAWLESARGRTRVGLLVAHTRRDAGALDGGLVPRAGVRHVGAAGDTLRGRLDERLLALAVSRGRAWCVACRRDGDRFAAATFGASHAVVRAAPRVGAGTWIEAGAAGVGEGRADVAFARDPRGRMALACALRPAAKGGDPARGALELDLRDPRFAAPEGRAESRPLAHAAVGLDGPVTAVRWRVEAHVLARRPYEPATAWLTARVSAQSGAWLELRRDAAPARTVVGLGRNALAGRRGALRWRAELRFDRRGLARERWIVHADRRLVGRLGTVLEAALGGGRGASGFVDPGVPGGAWVPLGAGDERTRVTLAWRGRVAPALTWVATDDAGGPHSAARLAVDFGARPSRP